MIQTSFTFQPESKDDIEIALQDCGITSYVEGSGELTLDLETETTKGIITCYLSTIEEATTLHSKLANLTGLNITITTKNLPDTDWQTAWQQYWKSIAIGKTFQICPYWEKDNTEKTKTPHTIYINPQMSFGTGTHETTQLCLELIETLYSSHPYPSFLDIGCGTGILSIAAHQLGATKIIGLDISDTIIQNANDNAALNNITTITFAQTPLSQITEQFDLVCANILSSTLKELWPDIQRTTKPNGKIILSGILTEELPNFLASLNLTPQATTTKGEWLAILLNNDTQFIQTIL